MKIVRTSDKGFEREFKRIVNRGKSFDPAFEKKVVAILQAVEKRGDRALFVFTKRFDSVALTAKTVEVSPLEIREALCNVTKRELAVLKLAAGRIERYHRRQSMASWSYREDGAELGQKIVPLTRVGVYTPGGLAAYPSTVLMAAIPARIAGVKEIVMTTPVGRGGLNPLIVAAAQIAGIDRIFKVGGAQAIAALAYGTASIPAVDKIVGPGNAWVATAKKLVFGRTGIDMIAGPSEILVIADGRPTRPWRRRTCSPRPNTTSWQAPSCSPRRGLCEAGVAGSDGTAQTTLARVDCREGDPGLRAHRGDEGHAEAAECQPLRPEHLELLVKDPKDCWRASAMPAPSSSHCTPEALGLPGRPQPHPPHGRYGAILLAAGVYDFVKRISVLNFDEKRWRNTANRRPNLRVGRARRPREVHPGAAKAKILTNRPIRLRYCSLSKPVVSPQERA